MIVYRNVACFLGRVWWRIVARRISGMGMILAVHFLYRQPSGEPDNVVNPGGHIDTYH